MSILSFVSDSPWVQGTFCICAMISSCYISGEMKEAFKMLVVHTKFFDRRPAEEARQLGRSLLRDD